MRRLVEMPVAAGLYFYYGVTSIHCETWIRLRRENLMFLNLKFSAPSRPGAKTASKPPGPDMRTEGDRTRNKEFNSAVGPRITRAPFPSRRGKRSEIGFEALRCCFHNFFRFPVVIDGTPCLSGSRVLFIERAHFGMRTGSRWTARQAIKRWSR